MVPGPVAEVGVAVGDDRAGGGAGDVLAAEHPVGVLADAVAGVCRGGRKEQERARDEQ